METRIKLHTKEECTRLASRMDGYNTHSMICGYSKGTDACQGDSGGPLFVENVPGRHQILGYVSTNLNSSQTDMIYFSVVSFGEGCAGKFPGIYAKLTEPLTLQWILEYLEDTESNTCADPKGDSRRSALALPPPPNLQQDDYLQDNYIDDTQSDWMQYIEDDVDLVL